MEKWRLKMLYPLSSLRIFRRHWSLHLLRLETTEKFSQKKISFFNRFNFSHEFLETATRYWQTAFCILFLIVKFFQKLTKIRYHVTITWSTIFGKNVYFSEILGDRYRNTRNLWQKLNQLNKTDLRTFRDGIDFEHFVFLILNISVCFFSLIVFEHFFSVCGIKLI